MKNMKNKNILLLLLTVVSFVSCNNWLDVTPKDKMLEDQQFSTEDNINSATNGLYREMTNENLYGGQLTQTTLEMMGHVYSYPPTQPATGNPNLPFYFLANFQYTQDEVKGNFSKIWKTAYSTLLHINVYIKNMNESSAIISEQNKKILLGEAYGLRAYIHFDLFRLFGPAWQNRTGDKILSYNNKAEATLNHTGYEETEYSTADEYMTLLLQDLTTSEDLLKDNDPIISNANSITNNLRNDNFYQNRNRRMNYYAAKGLEARVRQYRGEYAQAAEAAKVVTDQVGSGKRFNWVNIAKMIDQNNYIFFSEVIFGINNLDMISRATTYYTGTDLRNSYLVDYNNLVKNILGYDGSLSAMLDIRSKQWMTSNAITTPGYSINGTYRSRKYLSFIFPNDGTDIPAIQNLQALMRISEMYYIQAEAALKAGDRNGAIALLNTVLQHRGLTEQYYLTNTMSDTDLQAYIEKEYYRELTGEGQIFFFHKRRGSAQMFRGYDEGYDPVPNPQSAYVVPVPDDETNI